MSTGGGSTSTSSEVDLASQIDQLLDGMTTAAAGLAADQASEQIEAALAPTGDISSTPGTAEAPADEANADVETNGAAQAPDANPESAGPLDAGEVESLAQQIDALVDEVSEAAVPREVATSTPAEPATTDADQTGSEVAEAAQAPAGDEAVTQVSAGEDTAASGEPTVPVEQVTTPASLGSGLEVRAEEMPAVVAGEADAPASDVSGAPEIDLGDLDRQLAEMGSAREVESAEAAVVTGTPLPVAGQMSPPVRLEVVEAKSADAAGAPGAEVATGPKAGDRAKALVGLLGSVVVKGLRAGMSASARAMDGAPKVVRDTVGWVGLVTVFFACCMWAIVLLFRSTPVPETYGVASVVLEPGHPTPQPRPRPSAHPPADAHAKDDGHGSGGGGGGHGGGDSHGGGGGH